MGDKMRFNVAQIIIIAIVVPFAFAFATPATEDMGEIKSGPLLLFCESGHFKGLSAILEDISSFAQSKLDNPKRSSHSAENIEASKNKNEETQKKKRQKSSPAEEAKDESTENKEEPDILKRLWDLVVGSAVGSVTGGLCVLLCYYIWKLLTTLMPLQFLHGIWPVIPAVLASYGGCYLYTLWENESAEIDLKKVMYGMIAAIVIFIIFRIFYYHTSFIWQLVKGVFGALLGCAVSGAYSCVFCMYAMLTPGKLSGIGAYFVLFAVTAAAGILTAFEDILVDVAEKEQHDDLL